MRKVQKKYKLDEQNIEYYQINLKLEKNRHFWENQMFMIQFRWQMGLWVNFPDYSKNCDQVT